MCIGTCARSASAHPERAASSCSSTRAHDSASGAEMCQAHFGRHTCDELLPLTGVRYDALDSLYLWSTSHARLPFAWRLGAYLHLQTPSHQIWRSAWCTHVNGAAAGAAPLEAPPKRHAAATLGVPTKAGRPTAKFTGTAAKPAIARGRQFKMGRAACRRRAAPQCEDGECAQRSPCCRARAGCACPQGRTNGLAACWSWVRP